ncbi:hypothetical protein A5647_07590 [Mycobacterium sp. 1100029.7]|nr:hypothetical protein A5647_07590 [Mycobacterium sp. 1100029.7]
MKKLLFLGVCLIVGAELLVLIVHDRRFVLMVAGVALGLVLLNVRRLLGRGLDATPDLGADDLGDSLRRWLATTATTIRWSESTRADWDRHLRPMLARRYEIATGQRLAKDPMAFQSTGRMLFGDGLWEWVNPNNIARGADQQPGPGRATLEEILLRLEQV